MAASSLSLQYHVRSISLPSRLHPHPIKIEANLNKLKSLLPTTNSSSTETIQTGLTWLADLYSFVDELIQSPLTQQALFQHQYGILVEEALEGSVRLLDTCGAIRDLCSAMKARAQVLQSALRRKGGVLSIESNIKAYICFRKRAKKDIAKNLSALKQMENKLVGSSCSLLDVNHHLSMVIRVLREVTAITISMFRSLLLFFSVPHSYTKLSKWSLIANLMPRRSVASKRGQTIVNEAVNVDFAIHIIHGCIRNNDAKVDVQMVQKGLNMLDDSIERLEGGLDCLFRRLIQNRVSLLNILAL